MNIDKQLLTINKYSRCGTKIDKVKGLVVHYVGNPNSTAIANRNYFESLKSGKGRYASAHYIIGLRGEIIQCIPDNEMAYHVGAKTYKEAATQKLSTYPNDCTIGIECCHIDTKGTMTLETVDSLIALLTELSLKYSLESNDIYRHYDITGKPCHIYYVHNTKAWDDLKDNVTISMIGKSLNLDSYYNAVKSLNDKGIISNVRLYLYDYSTLKASHIKALIEKCVYHKTGTYYSYYQAVTKLIDYGVITDSNLYLCKLESIQFGAIVGLILKLDKFTK